MTQRLLAGQALAMSDEMAHAIGSTFMFLSRADKATWRAECIEPLLSNAMAHFYRVNRSAIERKQAAASSSSKLTAALHDEKQSVVQALQGPLSELALAQTLFATRGRPLASFAAFAQLPRELACYGIASDSAPIATHPDTWREILTLIGSEDEETAGRSCVARSLNRSLGFDVMAVLCPLIKEGDAWRPGTGKRLLLVAGLNSLSSNAAADVCRHHLFTSTPQLAFITESGTRCGAKADFKVWRDWWSTYKRPVVSIVHVW